MIGRFLAFVFFVRILGGPGISDAQVNPQNWGWKTTATAQASATSRVALPLDKAIDDRLSAAPHHLRLVNPHGALLPYAIQCGRTATTSVATARPVQIISFLKCDASDADLSR